MLMFSKQLIRYAIKDRYGRKQAQDQSEHDSVPPRAEARNEFVKNSAITIY